MLSEKRVVPDQPGWVFPVLYALLPNKSNDTYNDLFGMIRQIWPNFTPDRISIDFEIAAMNAAKTNFPQCQMDGCLFHFSKNIKDKLKALNLYNRYKDDDQFALHVVKYLIDRKLYENKTEF